MIILIHAEIICWLFSNNAFTFVLGFVVLLLKMCHSTPDPCSHMTSVSPHITLCQQSEPDKSLTRLCPLNKQLNISFQIVRFQDALYDSTISCKTTHKHLLILLLTSMQIAWSLSIAYHRHLEASLKSRFWRSALLSWLDDYPFRPLLIKYCVPLIMILSKLYFTNVSLFYVYFFCIHPKYLSEDWYSVPQQYQCPYI